MKINISGYDISLREEISDRYSKTGTTGVLLSGIDVVTTLVLPDQITNSLVESCLQDVVYRDELRTMRSFNSCFSFGSKETVTIDEPTGTGELPDRLQRQVGSYSLSKPFVCSFNDTTLFSTHAIAKNPTGRVILETGLAREDLTRRKLSMRPLDLLMCKFSNLLPRREITSSPVVPMVWGYGNYHHWVFNCLTMLQGIKQYTDRTGNECQLLIPPNPPPWIPQSLEFFAFSPDQRTEWKYRYGHVSEVVIPSIQRIANNRTNMSTLKRKIVSPTVCEWLREVATKNISSKKLDKFSDRVIISREDAGRRMIANKEEVYDTLYDQGFTDYQLANMTFDEQAALFLQADYIISPHGAGLSNLVFSKDCTVIEILGSHIMKPTYYMLAETLGLDYTPLVGQQPKNGSSYDDITVDVHDLLSAINTSK